MLKSVRRALAHLYERRSLPPAARREQIQDRQGLLPDDPGPLAVIRAGIAWLGEAQDRSASNDGGVARDFSLLSGWASSYPETTGYIAASMLEYADVYESEEARRRALRMLDWLVSIQLPGGGFQGGKIDAKPVVPVTFNTGQILLGLAAGAARHRHYIESMERAAEWLADTIDDDGCWRRFPTPFAWRGEKAYETHVAWGLFEAARVTNTRRYADAATANVLWALGHQHDNGWVANCNLEDPREPLTHTLGYFLRGVLEAYRYTEDARFLRAARLTADGLLPRLRSDGRLAGAFRADWSDAVDWVCLTGSAQVAYCWLMLYCFTHEMRYLHAALRATRFVRRTVRVDGPAHIRGAVKGSYPVDGDYGRFQYLSWAAKFSIDVNMLEQALHGIE